MTLDDLFMVPPRPGEARRVSPLGSWPEADGEVTRLERWRRYYRNNRKARIKYQREYRARQARAA